MYFPKRREGEGEGRVRGGKGEGVWRTTSVKQAFTEATSKTKEDSNRAYNISIHQDTSESNTIHPQYDLSESNTIHPEFH